MLFVPLPATELGTALSRVQGFADFGTVSRLQEEGGGGDIRLARLWTLSIYSDHSNAEHIFGDIRVLAWKWVKPAGP